MKLKNDKYRESRGGYARLLRISCEKCNEFICFYQKDGPGNIRRMYMDRMVDSNVSGSKRDLHCPRGHLLGIKVLYEKEERQSFRLFVDSIIKEVVRIK